MRRFLLVVMLAQGLGLMAVAEASAPRSEA
jgi:hypothetical protein